MIKKFKDKDYKKVIQTPCDVTLYQEGLSESGGPIEGLKLPDLKCRFIEKSIKYVNEEGQKVELVGKAILIGDIAPKLKIVSGGEIEINDIKYYIYRASRPRNPDGTVHHTTLELM